MLSENNKYLKLRKGVILNDKLDNVISKIDSYFEVYPREITSALRLKSDQMRIIINYANKEHLPVAFIQGDADSKHPADSIYAGNYIWEKTWYALLDKGYKINPPNDCTWNGRIIPASSHLKGEAFDIDADKQIDRDEIGGIVNLIMAKEKLIKSFTEEPKNGCFHINII